MSKIEWTDETWNPVTGCTRVSAGCDNCYAARMTQRLARIGKTKEKYKGLIGPNGHFNGTVRTHEDQLDVPKRWRKPRMILVCSISDLFDPDVPYSFIEKVFETMRACPQHTFQVLTKRPERMLEVTLSFGIPENVWVGTSIEDYQTGLRRLPYLCEVKAKTRFISYEPALGMVDLRSFLTKIDWVIAGGESGPGARPAKSGWFRGVRDQCRKAKVPFFMKQLGGAKKKGNKLEDIPKDLRVRQYPEIGGKW